MLNHNKLRKVDNIGMLRNLNTLVLSHNKLDTVDVRQLVNLRKLTLSHNQFRQ